MVFQSINASKEKVSFLNPAEMNCLTSATHTMPLPPDQMGQIEKIGERQFYKYPRLIP